MASLSEEMKNKRDVRRRATVLIIDKDLGNYGLYKSILAMEYELECVNSISSASAMCKSRYYDVIVVDGALNADSIELFYNEVVNVHSKEEKPILLVLEEASNKESIISYLSIGARDYIPKPFSKEGITNIIYEQLKMRRKRSVRQDVLIIDRDFKTLTAMKSYLEAKYNVNIINCCGVVQKYIEHRRPNLIISDITMFEEDYQAICAVNDKKEKIPVLFMTETPDAETVSKCAQYDPEGFLIKPIEENMLVKTLERIFLMESYANFGR